MGRLRTILRRYRFKIFGRKSIEKIDPTLRNLKLDENEKVAWIRDQYIHPLESLHTIDEVLKWFKIHNIEFISSIPSSDYDYDYDNIFATNSLGNFFSRILNHVLILVYIMSHRLHVKAHHAKHLKPCQQEDLLLRLMLLVVVNL